jgi:hypothetical protein
MGSVLSQEGDSLGEVEDFPPPCMHPELSNISQSKLLGVCSANKASSLRIMLAIETDEPRKMGDLNFKRNPFENATITKGQSPVIHREAQ